LAGSILVGEETFVPILDQFFDWLSMAVSRVRFGAPVFARTRSRCVLTVGSEIASRAAISALVSPSAVSSAISAARSVTRNSRARRWRHVSGSVGCYETVMQSPCHHDGLWPFSGRSLAGHPFG